MSGTAIAGSAEASIGLMPRYLRARKHTAAPAWAPGDEPAAEPAAPPAGTEPPVRIVEADLPSATEQLRQRIVDAAQPARRGVRPIWFVVGTAAAVVGAVVLFPDTIFAMLPNLDTAP